MIGKFTHQLLRQSRFFSTATFKSVPGHKAPIREESVDGRYAGVLFSVASKNNELDLVLADMEFISSLLKDSRKLNEFIQNSSNTRSEFTEVFSKLNGTFAATTNQFLHTLIEGKRVSDLPNIAKKFQAYYRHLNKEEGATVVSARELSADQKKRVQKTLEETYQGTTFTVRYQLDPTILGGLQIYFGNNFMDASLQSRVNVIRTEFEKLAI